MVLAKGKLTRLQVFGRLPRAIIILIILVIIIIFIRQVYIFINNLRYMPVTLYKAQNPLYIYDSTADLLIYAESSNHKITIADLETKKIIFQKSFAESLFDSFYIPGKFIQISSTSIYSIEARRELQVESYFLDYSDSKKPLDDFLKYIDTSSGDIYSATMGYYYVVFAVTPQGGIFYQAYDENKSYPDYGGLVAHAFNVGVNSASVGTTDVTSSVPWYKGPDNLLLNVIIREGFCLTECTTSSLKIKIYEQKEGKLKLVAQPKISTDGFSRLIIPFPKDRKEIYFLGSGRVQLVSL